MFDTTQWTSDQWAAFTGVVVAGLAAVTLLTMAIRAVRGWTAPAHPTRVRIVHDCNDHAEPRPTLALAARRLTDAELNEYQARWSAAHAARTTASLAPVVDPLPGDVAEHIAPGSGSLASIQAEAIDDLGMLTSEERRRDFELHRGIVRGQFAEIFDRMPSMSPIDPATGDTVFDDGGVMARFEAAIAPAMATAARWLAEATREDGLAEARRDLDRWRIDTPTGEYPLVRRAELAEATA